MPRQAKKKSLHEIMASIRSQGTKPELRVRAWLWAHGIRYRKNDRRLPGSPDIVVPGARVAIFVHGCFWHQHEGCASARIPNRNADFWTAKFDRNRERDARVRNRLRETGWRTMVIWECQLTDARLEATMTQASRLIAEAREEWVGIRRRKRQTAVSTVRAYESDDQPLAMVAETDDF